MSFSSQLSNGRTKTWLSKPGSEGIWSVARCLFEFLEKELQEFWCLKKKKKVVVTEFEILLFLYKGPILQARAPWFIIHLFSQASLVKQCVRCRANHHIWKNRRVVQLGEGITRRQMPSYPVHALRNGGYQGQRRDEHLVSFKVPFIPGGGHKTKGRRASLLLGRRVKTQT